MTDTIPQLVMYSGGRDSTLVACKLMLKSIPVFLFSADSGCSLHRGPLQDRIDRLRSRFGDLVVAHKVEDVSGTFRSIALENIEDDFLKYKKNLILLGEKLAIHVHAIDVCKRQGMTVMNDGINQYQKDFPEQRDVARDFLQSFTLNYGIDYRSPVYDSPNMLYVKHRLMQLGLSTKSLEGVTIFGDTFSTPSDETILRYLKDKKAIAQEITSFLLTGEPDMSPAEIQEQEFGPRPDIKPWQGDGAPTAAIPSEDVEGDGHLILETSRLPR
ncbi:MAG: hypothetical protein ACC628_05345 [Pirellulaceae bacterium]